jgi:hypothetical protein
MNVLITGRAENRVEYAVHQQTKFSDVPPVAFSIATGACRIPDFLTADEAEELAGLLVSAASRARKAAA